MPAELRVTVSAAPSGPNLCIYAAAPASPTGSRFSGAKSCVGLPSASGSAPAISYLAQAPLRAGAAPALFAEDSANLAIDVIGTSSAGTNLTLVSRLPIAAAGPIAAADLDRDGNTDLLIDDPLTGTLRLYSGNGDGTFKPATTILPGTPVQSFLLADLDGDGVPDLIAQTTAGAIEIHRGTGVPSAPFAAEDSGDPAPVLATSEARLLAIADVNEDGVPDLILATDAGPAVLLGRREPDAGAGMQFTAPAALPSAPAQYKLGPVVLADLDRDGHQDVATVFTNPADAPGSTDAAPALLTVWYGNGDGTFSAPAITPLDRSYTLAAATDLNGNGLPDLVLADSATLALFANQGSRAFAAPASFAVENIRTLATVALDHNGAQDLLVAGATALLSPRASARPRATGSSPTTTTLDLCIGPAQTCPSDGLVNPPYESSLTMYWGQTFNGTALASADDGTTLDPASTIAIEDSLNGAAPVTLCTLAIAYGATCPPSIGLTVGTGVGTHVFTAAYSGDATHAPSNSPSVTITVLQDTTTAALATSASPAAIGRPITFTATFTGSYAAPDGTVTFLDGTTVLGTATLVPSNTAITSAPTPSTASLTTSSLAMGSQTITASYPGSTNFLPASATVQQTIVPPAASATQLTSSLNPSSAGQAVTFTATVSAAGATPTGSLTFSLGATTLGTAALSGGIATFTTSTLPGGSDQITATYSGSATLTSSSASLTQTVDPLPPPGSTNFSIQVTPNPVSLGVGTTVQVTVKVTPLTGYSAPVTLSCGSLPYGTTCTFASQTIASGGGSTTLLLSAMAPHSCDATTPYFVAQGGGPAIVVVRASAIAVLAFAFGWFGVPRRRRWLRLLGALAAIALTLQITGCGNCTDLGTRPATYTVRISGTASANSETESVNIPVDVHL